ncbi:MAG: hypothetical protein JNL79_40495 [Myxococcales bacterium]|nr:hypothetical protein [Myxococcales bacterium]
MALVRVFCVDHSSLLRAVGSGDEKLVVAVVDRHARAVARSEGGPVSPDPAVRRAVGALVDGAWGAVSDEAVRFGLQLLCEAIGEPLDVGPFGHALDLDGAKAATLPRPWNTRLRALGDAGVPGLPIEGARVGHLSHRDLRGRAPNATVAAWAARVGDAEILVGFSG